MVDNKFASIGDATVWVPCIPNYFTGELIPMFTINNFPSFTQPSRIQPQISRGGIKNKDWVHVEDNKISELVKKLGTKNWSKIAKEVNKANDNWAVRLGKHCRERWFNHLDPKINKGEWSYAEDLKLLLLHKTHLNHWSKISKQLTGRTENSVKNRVNSLIKNGKQSMGQSFLPNNSIVEILIEQLSQLV